MRYRTKAEVNVLSLSEVLDALALAKIAPAEQRVYALDGPVVNGVITSTGVGPAWLESWQQQEIRETGGTLATLEQQINTGLSLEAWRSQLYQFGQGQWIESLGATKLQKELKARGAEASLWEARTFNRKQLEKKLWFAMATDKEKDEA